MSAAANIASVQERIAAATRRAGRRSEEIVLMAVSKTQPPERIREAYNAGQRLFGENRVQEFAGKAGALQDLREADWHMIGHLQTNKAAKSGVAPDSLALEELLLAATRLDALVLRGLMTVPPFTEDPEGARPYFRKLRELRDAIAARKLPSVALYQLSMGMSHDFEVAIEEGSTCVRVGTAIFGERTKA